MATNDKPKKTEADTSQLNWRYGSLSKAEQRSVKKWLSAQRNRNESISQVVLHIIERHGYKDILDFEVQRQLFADILNVGVQSHTKVENKSTHQEVQQNVKGTNITETPPVTEIVIEDVSQQELKTVTQPTTIVTEAPEIDGSKAEKRVADGDVTLLTIGVTEGIPTENVEGMSEPEKEQVNTDIAITESEVDALTVSGDFDDLLNSADLSIDLEIDD